jgi:hypothetical protein
VASLATGRHTSRLISTIKCDDVIQHSQYVIKRCMRILKRRAEDVRRVGRLLRVELGGGGVWPRPGWRKHLDLILQVVKFTQLLLQSLQHGSHHGARTACYHAAQSW